MTLRKQDIESLNLSAAWGRGDITPSSGFAPHLILYNNSLVGSPKILLLDKITISVGVALAKYIIEGAEYKNDPNVPGTLLRAGQYKAYESLNGDADGEIYKNDATSGSNFERANRPFYAVNYGPDSKDYEFDNPIVISRGKAWGVGSTTEEVMYACFHYRIIPE